MQIMGRRDRLEPMIMIIVMMMNLIYIQHQQREERHQMQIHGVVNYAHLTIDYRISNVLNVIRISQMITVNQMITMINMKLNKL